MPAAFPTVDANLAASRSQVSEHAGKLQPGANPRYNDFQPGITAAFEIDFWGKVPARRRGARARMLALEAGRGTVLASLYANVAQGYFALRGFDAQVALAEQTLATRRENLRLQQKRFEGGVVGELDVQQAAAEAQRSRPHCSPRSRTGAPPRRCWPRCWVAAQPPSCSQ